MRTDAIMDDPSGADAPASNANALRESGVAPVDGFAVDESLDGRLCAASARVLMGTAVPVVVGNYGSQLPTQQFPYG